MSTPNEKKSKVGRKPTGRLRKAMNLTFPDVTRSAMTLRCFKSGISISEFLTDLANKELGIK